MLKFFRRQKAEALSEAKSQGFSRGLMIGLAGALVLVVVILAIVFAGSIKNKLFNRGAGGGGDLAKLRITIVTSKKCENNSCFDINLFLQALRQNQIKETGLDTVYIENRSGKKLVEKYKITKVPTVLIAGELDKNAILQKAWPVLGEVIDKVFVFREVIPPYIEVASGQLKGVVNVVYLTDNSCAKCYDVNIHNFALKNLGITPKESKTLDVSSDEGKALVEKYKIKVAPTILLFGELDEYKNLQQIWPTYGEVTSDNTYIFTKVDEMGTYKDLVKNKVVEIELPDVPGAPATAASGQ
jgi:hypothetical protein